MPVILRHFWHDGYGGATLDQIAAELGVTKPTLYRTLGEKEAVFAAALGTSNKQPPSAQRSLGSSRSLSIGSSTMIFRGVASSATAP
jgi:hypothetical protein